MNYITDVNEVDDFARKEGEERWSSFTYEERQKLVFFASNDIEKIHGQPRQQYNIPWKFGDIWLKEACFHQVLFLTRVKGIREFVERARFMSSQNFSDGIVSLVNPGGDKFDSIAFQIVMQVLEKSGRSNQYEFERG